MWTRNSVFIFEFILHAYCTWHSIFMGLKRIFAPSKGCCKDLKDAYYGESSFIKTNNSLCALFRLSALSGGLVIDGHSHPSASSAPLLVSFAAPYTTNGPDYCGHTIHRLHILHRRRLITLFTHQTPSFCVDNNQSVCGGRIIHTWLETMQGAAHSLLFISRSLVQQ